MVGFDQFFEEHFGDPKEHDNDPEWDNSRQSDVVSGMRFHHHTFGDGTVMAVDFSNRWKMVIAFDDHGEKTIFASHLEPLNEGPNRELLIRKKIDAVAGDNQQLRAMLCEKYGIETYKPSKMDLPPVYPNEDGSVSLQEPKGADLRFNKQNRRTENVTRGLMSRDNLPTLHELRKRQADAEKAREAYQRWAAAGFPGRKDPEGPNKVCCRNCQWEAVWNANSVQSLKSNPQQYACPACKSVGTLYIFRPLRPALGGVERKNPSRIGEQVDRILRRIDNE
jgi:hypothetical protein